MRKIATMLLVGSCACAPERHAPAIDEGATIPVFRGAAPSGEAEPDAGAASAIDAAVEEDGAVEFDAAPPAVVHAPFDAGPPRCDPTAQWGTAVVLAVASTGVQEVPGSVTPDELTIAWTTAQGHVRYADRASTQVDFQIASPLVGTYAVDRAALSPDGLRLALTSADGRSFAIAVRASRSDPFGAPSEGEFAVIDADAATSLAPDEALGDVVLGGDDRVLYYSRYSRSSAGAGTVLRATRLFASDPWQIGVPLAIAELTAQSTLRRRPTGLSVDGRTLFFWDEALGAERAGWFTSQGDAFERVLDLGDRGGAAPNAACDRLYFGALGRVSNDLFFADRR